MKTLVIAFLFIAACVTACRKTSVITSRDALLQTSADSLHFDTVFTTTGSVTKSFKVFNPNDRKLRLSKMTLMGSTTSAFRMNVDGTAGTDFSDIEIEANDSMYVFVSVSINPNAANLPFVVRDSIRINYNGNDRFVQLEAFGQNALFWRNRVVASNETLTNNLPVVILGGLVVNPNVTLTIARGTKIYSHADAPIIINGTLKVNGEKFDSTRVVFAGDRLDADYRDFPGSWPGIIFSSSSKDNVLNYAVIKNAYQGIAALGPASNGLTKVTLNQCIVDNVYDAGIICLNSSLDATNCLVSNCGANIGIGGGKYNFTYCTVVSYGSNYLYHKSPVLTITNTSGQNQLNDVSAVFRNCIFYGDDGIVDDEIFVDKKAGMTLTFQNVLYKTAKTDPAALFTFVNAVKNQSPQFDSIDAGKRFYNFRLNSGLISGTKSPAIDKGILTNPAVAVDLDGKARIAGAAPDLGCYETQ